jgi:SAM-dependent methyltransferase
MRVMAGFLHQIETGRRAGPGFAPRRPLSEIVADLGYSPDWNWSWNTYKDAITQIANEYGLSRHLEIGGGRDTLFTPDEARSLGLDITVNDISAKELALAPAAFGKVCCDVAAFDTMETIEREAFDFVYSRMVMEHVRDSRQLWENQYDMLADGGVALAFFPTLYAPAFALNRMVPEGVSSAILKRMFPDRHDDGDNPKFPAFYDNCYGSADKLAPMLEEIGFRNVLVLPFYGYSYFWKLPVLKQVDAAFTRFVRERDWRTFTSFAYVIAEK